MSRIGVHFEGDAADLIQEMAKVVRKTKEQQKELDKLTRASNKLTNEQKKLAREAKRVYDDTRTPQERHLQKMEQLNRLVRKGAIDQDTYRRAVGQSQQQLQQAGQAGEKAFGPAALGKLANYAMGFVSVGGAIALATRALRAHEEKLEAVAQKQRDAFQTGGALYQLDEAAAPQRMAQAAELYMAGATQSQAEAERVMFQLESAGAVQERKFVGRLAIVGGEQGVAGLIAEAAKLEDAFRGGDDVGTYKERLSKAVAAAGPVKKAGMAELMAATTKAAGAAGTMGLRDEELFAAVSLVARVYGPDEGATAISRMLENLATKRPELKGKPLQEMMQILRAEKMTEKEKVTLMQARGMRAYRILDPEAVQGSVEMVEAGQRGEIIDRKIDEARKNARLRAILERRKAKAKLEVAYGDEASMQELSDSLLDIEERERLEWGQGRIALSINRWINRKVRAVRGPEAFAESALGPLERHAARTGDEEMLEELRGIRATLGALQNQRPVQVNNN